MVRANVAHFSSLTLSLLISSFNVIIYYSCLDNAADDNKPNNKKVECDAASTSSTSKTADEDSPLKLKNPYIKLGEEDVLYHLALSNKSHNFANMFGDVKVHINLNILIP